MARAYSITQRMRNSPNWSFRGAIAASPESITTIASVSLDQGFNPSNRVYGFRAPSFARPRNDLRGPSPPPPPIDRKPSTACHKHQQEAADDREVLGEMALL